MTAPDTRNVGGIFDMHIQGCKIRQQSLIVLATQRGVGLFRRTKICLDTEVNLDTPTLEPAPPAFWLIPSASESLTCLVHRKKMRVQLPPAWRAWRVARGQYRRIPASGSISLCWQFLDGSRRRNPLRPLQSHRRIAKQDKCSAHILVGDSRLREHNGIAHRHPR